MVFGLLGFFFLFRIKYFEMELTIKERTITLKFGLRAMMAFERITKKSFEISDMQDIIVLFFCCVITSDKDIVLTWDEFVDYLDENQAVMADFSEWYTSIMLRNDMVSNGERPSEEDVKKAKKKKAPKR